MQNGGIKAGQNGVEMASVNLGMGDARYYPEIKDEDKEGFESEKAGFGEGEEEIMKKDKKKKKKHRHRSHKKQNESISQDEEILDFDVERGSGEGVPAYE